MARTIDITNYTDNAVEVILAARAQEVVDCDHLTREERYQVAEALGWDMDNVHVKIFLHDEPKPRDRGPNFDYEGAILDSQEDFRS